VRVAGAAPALVRGAVTVADVPPSVCDWFGTDSPRGAFGRSLLPSVRGAPLPDRGPTIAQVVEDDPPERVARRWSVRDGARKAVFDVTAGTSQLFDLNADPMERHDVGAERDAELDALWVLLREWRRAAPDPSIPFDREFSAEEMERLGSLGYLGGADNP
jgi:arylsulfatase A-like enzyme